MASWKNKLFLLLSGRNMSIAIIGMAIACRVIQLIYFYTIGFDLSYQVLATHSFITGHGISIPLVSPADLSATLYEPLIRWPPGYTVLLSPFYLLFGHNYIAAGLTLDILAAVTLILVSRSLLKLLAVSVPMINIYTLLTAFFIYPFYFIASSDAIAISAFIIALYYCLSWLKYRDHGTKNMILMVVFLFLSGFTKYLFMPVVLILPLFIFLKGRADRDKYLQKAGILSLLALVVTLGAVLLYQATTTGSGVYISEQGRGFYPEHLLTAYPFIPGSFLKPDTLSILLREDTNNVGLAYRSFQFIHILAFIFFVVYAIKAFSRQGLKNTDAKGSFFWLSFLISFAITVLLAILSLRVPKEEIMPGFLWTYIQEPRYYGLIFVLLHLSVLIVYQFYLSATKRYLQFGFYLLLLLSAPEIARGIFFTGNRLVKLGRETYTWQLEHRFQQYADTIIQEAKKEEGTDHIIVTGSSLYVNHRIGVYSHIPILPEPVKMNDLTSLYSREKVLVLFIVEEKALSYLDPALSANGMKRRGNYAGFQFYTISVDPR